MPGAKLTGIKSIMMNWKRSSKDTKIVIFTQFTDVLVIFGRNLSGETRIQLRYKILEDFERDPEITVLIVSLRNGGTGLDMTVAHKCILVDLWWNEAVENQAFCRLLRHGQTKNVECLKMVVKDTIEDYMLNLQIKKTEDITSTMSDDILKKRDTIVAILKLFADVNEDGSGRLHVKRERQGKVKDALAVKGKGKRGKRQ
ncbi:C-terminal helicase domain-containing protein [Aspergillus stella-maris]|uniref:C-terminal helicase domain-containing protein n=1 Tax=Aspergillus stella-maris TaxID=1810926 RepID=UPI003CCDD07B